MSLFGARPRAFNGLISEDFFLRWRGLDVSVAFAAKLAVSDDFACS